MAQPSEAGTNSLSRSARERLTEYLAGRHGVSEPVVIALTPDASTREYFRIPWKRTTAVAAVYPEAFDPELHPYLDVTRLFLECGLPVPEVYAVDGESGIIVQEDLGDNQLCRVFEFVSEDEREDYLDQAVRLICQIQAATETAFKRQSIASRLAFDEVKLSWELGFFMDHYFGSLRHEELQHTEAAELKAELNDIAAELAARPRVLCHRDFHAANLLVDREKRLRVVDHQDARMGPASYDLVSLVLDRQPSPPSLADLRAHRLYLIEERRRHGLESLDPDEFSREFRLMTVQRGLKAIGTFSYQTAVCGRGAFYESFIEPTFQTVLLAARWLDRFPALQRAITGRISNANS